MRKGLLLPLFLLVAAAAFAWLAPGPPGGLYRGLYPYEPSAELAEGLAVASLVCLAAMVLRIPGFLKKKVTIWRPLRFALTLTGVVGFGVFLYGMLCDILFAITGTLFFEALFRWGGLLYPPFGGIVAATGLVVASASLFLLRIKEGLHEGLKAAALLIAASVLVLQVFLLVFDYKEEYVAVSNFALGWAVFNLPVVSNSFALIVSGALLFSTLRSRSFRAFLKVRVTVFHVTMLALSLCVVALIALISVQFQSQYALALSGCVQVLVNGGTSNSTFARAICQQGVGEEGLSHAVPYNAVLWTLFAGLAATTVLLSLWMMSPPVEEEEDRILNASDYPTISN